MPSFLKLSCRGFVPVLMIVIAGLLVTLSVISFKLATQDNSQNVEGVSYSLIRKYQSTAIPEASQEATSTEQSQQ